MVFSCNRESKKVQTVWLELESFHHTELMIISILTSFNESFTYKKYNPVKDWCVFLSVTIFLTWCNFKFEPQTAALRNWNVLFFFLLAGPTAPTATAIAATPTTGAPVRAADTAENVPWRMETLFQKFFSVILKKKKEPVLTESQVKVVRWIRWNFPF